MRRLGEHVPGLGAADLAPLFVASASVELRLVSLVLVLRPLLSRVSPARSQFALVGIKPSAVRIGPWPPAISGWRQDWSGRWCVVDGRISAIDATNLALGGETPDPFLTSLAVQTGRDAWARGEGFLWGRGFGWRT